jgi:L-threonylcarbamoyladenylate synthase
MVDLENDIRNSIAVLEQGGTILYPTDSIWGIGCDALNERAVEKVFALKKRPKEKSLVVLLAEAKDVLQYVASPPPDIIAIIESFEVPTTVIYEGALDFAENVVNSDGTVAIRVTNDIFCKALIKRYGKPIVSTSANISGRSSPSLYSEIDKEIVNTVDYVVEYRKNDKEPKRPSRLVRIDDDGNLDILRS